MRFADRVALITGGARGIGKSVAEGIADEGGKVAVFDMRGDVAEATVAGIRAKGAQALAVKVDVTSSAAVTEAVKQVLAEFGKIDILVSNAGWNKYSPFVQSAEDDWDKLIAINLKAHLICFRAVLDGMIARKSGKIVAIASDAGRSGSLGAGSATYAGCKAGVIGFSKAIAMEMAPFGINVNCVSPGFAETQLLVPKGVENMPKELQTTIKSIPMRRLGQPDEIAEAVLFLASDESSYVTGQVISVNGGVCMPS